MLKPGSTAPGKRKRPPSVARGKEQTAGAAAQQKALSILAQESFQNAVSVLIGLGLPRKEAGEAMRRALHSRRKSTASAETLARYSQIGLMMNLWRRDKRFVGADGEPKVLPIYGTGATFETLARKFAPGIPVRQLADFICRHGDATRSSKDIKLVGSNVVIYARAPEVVIAALNENFQDLANTLRKNTSLPRGQQASGFFQRTVSGFQTERKFNEFAHGVRPQLQDLCNVVEGAVDDGKGPKGSKKRFCGMSIFLFQDPAGDRTEKRSSKK